MKKGSNLKKSREKYRKVWREETEGENNMIIKIKNIKKYKK